MQANVTSKHTPRPWKTLPVPPKEKPTDAPGGAGIATVDGKTLIAVLCWDFDEGEWTPENEANARLIAAAPDLLEALESALEALVWASGSSDFNEGGFAREGWLRSGRPAIATAHLALKKARGS